MEKSKNDEKIEWFGLVRWCDEDIREKLGELGIPDTEENVKLVKENCKNNTHFTDTMIVAGWEMIEQTIQILKAGGMLSEY